MAQYCVFMWFLSFRRIGAANLQCSIVYNVNPVLEPIDYVYIFIIALAEF